MTDQKSAAAHNETATPPVPELACETDKAVAPLGAEHGAAAPVPGRASSDAVVGSTPATEHNTAAPEAAAMTPSADVSARLSHTTGAASDSADSTVVSATVQQEHQQVLEQLIQTPLPPHQQQRDGEKREPPSSNASTYVATPRSWEEHEPADDFCPVPHFHLAKSPGVDGWQIVGASRRGKMHAHEAKYREDAWCAAVSDGKKWNIIAVADGGGSYKLSRIGSEIAVQTAVKTLIETLPEREFIVDAISGVLVGAMDKAYLALEQKAQELAKEYSGIATRDLSTTLLILAHCPEEQIVCTAQVGDGLIALQKDNGEPVRLAESESGLAAGEVVFLNNVTSREWRRRVWQYRLTEKPRFLVAMTDGVADDVLETKNNFSILFEALEDCVKQSEPESALNAWLNYEKRGSFDDRTLVLICPE